MSSTTDDVLGSVAALWRYPVKSMMGEELSASDVTEQGLVGDRAYALIDTSSGKVASAKAPRKWGKLFEFRAAYAGEPRAGEKLPPVRITFPDGTTATSEESNIGSGLSGVFSREVTLATEPPAKAKYESVPVGAVPADLDGPTVDYPVRNGFFDLGAIHLLTTATIERLGELYPQGRFEARRFRPNIVLQTPEGEQGFVENGWPGKTLAIGDEVRIRVMSPTIRCVMTTLAQGDLPADPGILRTAAQHNQGNVGVYALVVQGGTVRLGDEVRAVDNG
jgi:hypothetical protein